MNKLAGQIEPSTEPKNRTWRKWRPRLRLVDMFWLTLLCAILIMWHEDRQRLIKSATRQPASRGPNWSIDQLLGKPNTPISGDQVTAWAPRMPDNGIQWCIVEFPKAVDVAKLEIIETYNPGAIVSVSTVSTAGDATEIWSGNDPVVPVAGMGTAVIKPKPPTRTRRIKIELDTSKVSGWNEIDAISIFDDKGRVQWASRAWASSSYGKNRDSPSWFWP